MPAVIPFTLEYLIGGLQIFTVLIFYISTLDPNILNLQIENNNLLQLLCLLSFAYPIGIAFDNIAAHFLTPIFNGNAHRGNFNRIITKSESHTLDRIIEFQRSKRITRITLGNIVLAELLLLFVLFVQQEWNELNAGLCIILPIVFVLILWTYSYVSSNYEKFLSEMVKIDNKQ